MRFLYGDLFKVSSGRDELYPDEPLLVHRRSKDHHARGLAVFVHGLGGTRYGTWKNFPKFLYEDVSELDVGVYWYRTGWGRMKFSASIELDREANVFADVLRDCGANYDSIILIGHSMGGLLIKAGIKDLIDRAERATLERIGGLFLLATPQAGSLRVPLIFSWLTKDTKALKPHGQLITEVMKTFTDRVVSDNASVDADRFLIPTWIVSGAEDFWVDQFSAGLNVPSQRRKTVRGGHTEVVKPKTKQSDAYDWVLTRIRDEILGATAARPSAVTGGETLPPILGLERHLEEVHQNFAKHMAMHEHTGDRQVEEFYTDLKVRELTSLPSQPIPTDRMSMQGVRKEIDSSMPAVREGTRLKRPEFRTREATLVDFVHDTVDPCLVLGGGGSGKSTSLWKLASVAAADAARDPRAPVPIQVDLANFSNAKGVDELVRVITHATSLEITRLEMMELWRKSTRPFLFLFDGLNEVSHELQADCARALKQFIRVTRHRYVVTSRPGGEAAKLAESDVGFRVLEIVKLDPDQVRNMLAQRGAVALTNRLSDKLLELATNPFNALALVQSCADLPEGELPRNRGLLFRAFVAARMRREQKKRNLVFAFEEVKEPVLARLAEQMTDSGRTRQICNSRLKDDIGLVLERADQKYPRRKIMPRPWTVEEFLDELLQDGLLHKVDDAIEFTHESLQEYFTAVAELTTTSDPTAALELATDPEVVAGKVPKIVWRQVQIDSYDPPECPTEPQIEVVIMLAGLLEDASDLVLSLLSRNPLVAAACSRAASSLREDLQVLLVESWLNLLNRAHGRYHWIGCGCVALTRVSDKRVVDRLLELVLSLRIGASSDAKYKISSAAGRTLALVDPDGAAELLVSRLLTSSEDQYQRDDYEAGALLRSLESRHAVGVLFNAWRQPKSETVRLRAQALLASMPHAFVTEELERIDGEGSPDATDIMADAIAKVKSGLEEWEPANANEPIGGLFSVHVLELAANTQQGIREEQTAAAQEFESAEPALLLEALGDPAIGRRLAAADSLKEFALDDSAPYLLKALISWDETWSIEPLTKVLVKCLGEERAVTAIENRLEGEDAIALFPVDSKFRSALQGGRVSAELVSQFERFQLRLNEGPVLNVGDDEWELPTKGTNTRRYRIVCKSGELQAVAEPVLENLLIALKVIGSERSLHTLINAMNNAPVYLQSTAIQQLAELSDMRAADGIAKRLLTTDDSDVAGAAIKALGLFGGERSVEVLVEVLFRLKKPKSQRAFGEDEGWGVQSSKSWGETIHEALTKIKDRERLPSLLAEHLKSDDEWIRELAIREVRRWLVDQSITPDEFTSSLLDAALSDPSMDVQVAAAQALKWTSEPHVIDRLHSVLADGEPDQRVAAAEALGWIEDESSVDFLCSALDDIPVVQIAVATALGRMRADTGLNLAVERMLPIALDEIDEQIRRQAGMALREIEGGIDAIYAPVTQALGDNNFQSAIELVDERLPAFSDDANLHWWRAHSLEGLDRLEEALHSICKAGEYDPKSVSVHRFHAAILYKLERYEEALGAAERGVQASYMDATAYRDLSVYAYKCGAFQKAIDALTRILEIDPKDTEAVFNRAIVYLEDGRVGESRKDFEQALEISGQAEMGTTRPAVEVAIKDLEELASRHPDRSKEASRTTGLLRAWLETVKDNVDGQGKG